MKCGARDVVLPLWGMLQMCAYWVVATSITSTHPGIFIPAAFITVFGSVGIIVYLIAATIGLFDSGLDW
jgi:hypothetical protein